MSELTMQNCEACRVGAPKVSDDEAKDLMTQIPEWSLITRDGIPMLQRAFSFKGYKKAVALTNKVAELAKEEGHHPEILLEWGKVTVTWWTHAINSLHKNDFICAAKTDALIED